MTTAGPRAGRATPVEKAEVSKSARAKAAAKQTPDGLPVHSFRTLLANLGTYVDVCGRPLERNREFQQRVPHGRAADRAPEKGL